MGLFLLITALFAAVFAWTFPAVRREKRRADTAAYLAVFLLAWAAAGAVCLLSPPGLYAYLVGSL